MKMKTLTLAPLLILLNNAPVNAMQNDEVEAHRSAIAKKSFVLMCEAVGANCGANWSVDYATKLVQTSLHSGSSLFDLTLGSYIRGKSLTEAIPLAEKYGAVGGVTAMSFLAPLIWDYGPVMSNAILYSSRKISRFMFEDNIPTDQRPTLRDVLKVGLTLGGGFWAVYSALY